MKTTQLAKTATDLTQVSSHSDLRVSDYVRLKEYSRFGIGFRASDTDSLLRDIAPADLGYLELLSPTTARVTRRGEAALKARRAKLIASKSRHNLLAKRAAKWLEQQGRIALLDCEFRLKGSPDSRVLNHLGLQDHDPEYLALIVATSRRCRPDVFSCLRNAVRTDCKPWILECKVTRADFFRDVDDPAKRYRYALLAETVFYLCPKDLVSLAEVPVGCGLIC
jgi:hypothetical protein